MMADLLLSSALRVALVLAVGLAASGLLARAAATTRRLVLVMTFGAALLVPLVAAVGPRWSVDAPAAWVGLAHESATETATAGPTGDGATIGGPAAMAPGPARPASAALVSPGALGALGALGGLAWLVGAAALLARAVASRLRARGLVRRAAPVESATWLAALGESPATLRVSTEIDSPFVTGLGRATIVIPADALTWSRERCCLVLAHELAHARRRDVLAQAVGDVVCALHWFNPLAWLGARRLRDVCEVAADDAVLGTGVRPSRYAEELVAVATALALPSAALAMADRSSLEQRVTSILAARLRRAPLAARGTGIVLALGVAFAAAAACASPQDATRTPDAGGRPPRGPATDAAFQRAVDAELAALTTAWSPVLATIVVLDPATGEILANAGSRSGKPADAATTVALAPGSTLKPILIAAALEQRAITVDQKFDCAGPRLYGARAIRDASPNGTLDVAHLLAVSSNTGASKIFDALGGEDYLTTLQRFHFGAGPGALPARVATGSYEGAELAIGDSMTATPLQMVAAYGALAADGVYHAPTLEHGAVPGERLVSSETAAAVLALLETAVSDEAATGRAARVDGAHVAGKTGTAGWIEGGRAVTYASFIGIADLPERRVVILVGVVAPREDMSGGKVAAPAFARIVSRVLHHE